MDTVHTDTDPRNMDGEQHMLTRKEIRRQKLMEYLAAKANVTLPSNKTDLSKGHVVASDKSTVKVVTDKENKIPVCKKDTKENNFQSTYTVKKPLGLKNTANVSSSQLCEKLKSTYSIYKESKAPRIPVFTRTYTVTNLKPKPNATNQKPPITRARSTVTQTTKANTTKTCPNAANTSVKKTHTGRLIHGPIIKTRTGLTPAVLQPRNSKSLIITAGNDSKIAQNKTQPSSTSYRPASQVSNRSLRRTMPAGAFKTSREVTVKEGGTKANFKQGQNGKSSDRPRLSSRCSSVMSVKADVKAKSARTNATDSRFRSQPGLSKSKPAQGKTLNTSTATGFKKNKMAAASSLGGKSRISNAPPVKPICPPAASKQKKMPLVSQTVPQPPRNVNFTRSGVKPQGRKPSEVKPQGRKQSEVKPQGRDPPQTVQKTLVAAEERIKKLHEWRAAKGISYKRPPMLVKAQSRRTIAVPQPFWSTMEQEDEARSLVSAVDRSLDDCIKLLGEGCMTQQVKDVLSRLPAVARKFAKYWICQARVMERDGDLDVLPMFETAVGVVVEPIDELRTVVFDILKKRDENQEKDADAEETAEAVETTPETFNDPLKTPKPTRALICAEKGNSSVVKYKITATPGGPPSQRRESTVVNGQEVRFFTPVRRSVRIERASLRYPASLQDHDLCVGSYNDLMAEEEKENVQEEECVSAAADAPLYIYRENDALKDKVSVEYVCSDE